MDNEWVGFDIETGGIKPEYALQAWRVKDRQAWLRSWAVSDGSGHYVTAASMSHRRNSQALRRLLTHWIDHGIVVATWNAAFEIAWLAAHDCGDLVPKVKWLDAMLLWRHLENMPEYEVASTKRRSFSLKAAVTEFFPDYAGYDGGVDFEGPILPLMHYNACDAIFTRALSKIFHKKLSENPRQLRCALIEAHSLPAVGIADYTGLPVHEGHMAELDESLKETIEHMGGELAKHGATPEVLASPTQLGKLLFGDWGLTPVKFGKTGPSTDKETLVELATVDPRARTVRSYREAMGNRTKFVTNVRESIDYNNDRRTHPQARVFGTYTGRLTYSSHQGKGVNQRQTGFALHQMKRDKLFRQLIKATPGHTMVELDAAGQEFRWMAILSGDPTMLSLCLPGEDPHSYMGSQVAARDYHEVIEGAHAEDPFLKRVRQMGKVANLSLQFRTSAQTLCRTAIVQHGMEMDMGLAEKIHRTYRGTYRMVPRYWDNQIAKIKHQLWVQTLAGRRVSVSPEMVRRYGWSVESTSINFPVQGTGGDQKYLAMSLIRPLLASTGARFAIDLHDGLYFMVPDESLTDFIEPARELFDNLPYKKAWGIDVPIPLPWDVKVGKTWGDMVELKKGDTL